MSEPRHAPTPDPAPAADIEVVAGLVIEAGRVLVARRMEHQSFAGHWEFPGGKIEKGESPEAALAREFREEMGIGARVRKRYDVVTYRNREGRTVRVTFFLAARDPEEPRLLDVAEVRWADAEELRRLVFIPANRPVVARVAKELESGGL
jgi:8-oxo-dGTP diphosphatase